MTTPTTTPSIGEAIKSALNLIIVVLTRGTNTIDNTLQATETASMMLNRTVQLGDDLNKSWATDTMARRNKETKDLLEELELEANSNYFTPNEEQKAKALNELEALTAKAA